MRIGIEGEGRELGDAGLQRVEIAFAQEAQRAHGVGGELGEGAEGVAGRELGAALDARNAEDAARHVQRLGLGEAVGPRYVAAQGVALVDGGGGALTVLVVVDGEDGDAFGPGGVREHEADDAARIEAVERQDDGQATERRALGDDQDEGHLLARAGLEVPRGVAQESADVGAGAAQEARRVEAAGDDEGGGSMRDGTRALGRRVGGHVVTRTHLGGNAEERVELVTAEDRVEGSGGRNRRRGSACAPGGARRCRRRW